MVGALRATAAVAAAAAVGGKQWRPQPLQQRRSGPVSEQVEYS